MDKIKQFNGPSGHHIDLTPRNTISPCQKAGTRINNRS